MVVPLRDVSVVIPTWNGRHLLEEFLPSVLDAAARHAREARAAVEVVIVDDGSSDDTEAWVLAAAGRTPVPLRVLRSPVNAGFGDACNRGIRGAAHPLVFLLNNDVRVEDGILAPLAARFDDDARLLGVHCRVLDEQTGQQAGTGKMGGFARGFLRVHQSYVVREPRTGDLPSMFASGGCSLFHRARFLELGGFDPLFAPFYLEDVELGYRAWKRGLTVGYEPRATVRHRFSSTIRAAGRRRVERISQRNRLMLHWIHLTDRRLLLSHAVWVTIVLITSPLRLKLQFPAAFADAVSQWRPILARRHQERQRASRSDRDILKEFDRLRTRPDIRVYDREAEVADAVL